MKKILLLTFTLFIALVTNTAFAQTKEQAAEISPNVPELSAFHTIIAPMWHTAYPAKDIAALKALVPQIKANMEKMNIAKLPGILREKETAWKNELVKFNVTAENYYKACAGDDAEAILLATEKFHSGYEAMNRAVKPFVKEMDEYHITLYVIYHKLMPEKKYTEVANLMDKLILQADAITKYPQDKLVKRLKDNTPKFYDYAAKLSIVTVDLKEVLKGADSKKIDAAIEKTHSAYRLLETAFN